MENDKDDDEVPRFGGKINEKFLDWETDVRRGGRDETSPWSTSPQEKDSLDSRKQIVKTELAQGGLTLFRSWTWVSSSKHWRHR